jgi:hypothetical protein
MWYENLKAPCSSTTIGLSTEELLCAQQKAPELNSKPDSKSTRPPASDATGRAARVSRKALWVSRSLPVPDFSDCNGSSRESTFDWRATIHEGGPTRGWVDIMPSFAEAHDE